MREADVIKDLDLIRSITPDQHMRRCVGYLHRAEWEGSDKFKCYVEPDAWWLAFYLNTDSIRVLALGVSEKCRSHGIGGKVFKGLIDYARRLGKKKVTLRTRPEGREFLFLTRLGFSVIKDLGEDVEMLMEITQDGK